METLKQHSRTIIISIFFVLGAFLGFNNETLQGYGISMDTLAWASDIEKVDKEQLETSIKFLKDERFEVHEKIIHIDSEISTYALKLSPIPKDVVSRKARLDDEFLELTNKLTEKLQRLEQLTK